MLGEGMVIFGVARVAAARNEKSSPKIGPGRPSLPVMASLGGAKSRSPSSR